MNDAIDYRGSMTIQPHRRLFLFRRITNQTTLVYLLLITLYLLLRFTIGDRHWVISEVNSFALLLFIPLPILFLLSLLAGSRRALLYLLPVILLAVIWIGPRFLPKNPVVQAANATTFRVMSSNVSHFNIDPERVPRLALAETSDIIFLQEVQLSDQQPAFSTLDTAYPYQTRQQDQMRTGMYSAVNITYSRFPFVTSEEIDPHIPEMPTIYRNVIELSGQRIALYNIHLLSPGGAGRLTELSSNYFVRYALGFDDAARNRQIDALLAYLATEPYPYIAAGDFNTSDFSMTYTHLAAQMHDSFAEAGIGLGSSWPAARAFCMACLHPAHHPHRLHLAQRRTPNHQSMER
jgi:endonuclease/exonuclease/phosphatase (EEP) superfamily protein YafD